jgi:hypothetical protein
MTLQRHFLFLEIVVGEYMTKKNPRKVHLIIV